MIKRTFWLCLCALLISTLPMGAQATLGGPISGYVFESASHSIRPILGLPGSSWLGDALVSGVDWAAVAPGGALALASRDGVLYAVRGLDSTPTFTAVEGALASPEQAAFARGASAAAISSNGWVQFLRDLDGAPRAEAPIEFAPHASALLLDRSGQTLVAAARDEQGGGIYLATAGEAPRLLAAVDRPAGLVAALNGRDLLVADGADGRILEVRNFRDDATVMLFAETGLADTVGLALSRDGRTLFAAGKSGRIINAFDMESRALASQIELDFEPSFVQPLSGDFLFLLKANGDGGDPLFVLDAGRAPAVYFVPAGRGE